MNANCIRHSAFAIRFLLFGIAKFYLIHNLLAVFTSVSFRFISSGYHHHLHDPLLHHLQSNQHKEQRMTARSRIEKRLGYAYFSWRWWRPQRLQCRHASGPAVRHFVRQSIMFETSSFILCVSGSLPMRNHAANTQNIKPPSVWHNENAGGHICRPLTRLADSVAWTGWDWFLLRSKRVYHWHEATNAATRLQFFAINIRTVP